MIIKTRIDAALNILKLYHEQRNDLIFRIVTGDETWVHHHISRNKETKHDMENLKKALQKCVKSSTLLEKSWQRFSGTIQYVILVDFLETGRTITAE